MRSAQLEGLLQLSSNRQLAPACFANRVQPPLLAIFTLLMLTKSIAGTSDDSARAVKYTYVSKKCRQTTFKINLLT